MNTYTFCIATEPESVGYITPRDQWESNYIAPEWSGTIIITMHAEAWDSFPESVAYEGSGFQLTMFQNWMRTAFCMRGHMLNPQYYSPRQLYEALSVGWKYEWKVEGNVPEDPYSPADHNDERAGIE